MQIQLAQRMEAMKASEIREILKLTRKPSVISFAGGLPAPETFPVAEMQAVAGTMLASRGCEVMQYSTTEGEADLREWIAGRMNGRLGTSVEASEILVTSGSQQGLDLTGKVLLDEGDEVLCESPTYLGAIQAFTAYRPRFVEVPTDDDGMLPEELAKRLAGCRRPKIIYVVPDFQNPSGRSWSLERRRQVRDVASRFPVVIVEDNPYGELRFEGVARPPLKAMDRHGQVVMLGTFSKILCPGLRLGWIAAPVELLEKYVLVKQGADLHTSTLCQRLAADYVRGYDLDAAIGRIRELYRRRRDVMVAALERELPAGIRFTRPSGGLFLWVELPQHLSGRDLLVRCLEHDVAFVPGGSFFPNGGHENTLRLNFSAMPEPRIEEGVRRLARAIREMLADTTVPASA
jgi:DNA-binding transcriptional MocR family regulator